MSRRSLCIPETPFGLFLLSISMITAILLLPLLGYGIMITTKLQLPKTFSIIYWMSVFTLFIAGISMPINQLFNFEFSGYCNDFDRIIITAPLSVGSYLISISFVCCLYFVRYIETFKDSPYFTHSILIYISFIFAILMLFIFAVVTVRYIIEFWWILVNNPGHTRNILKNIAYLFMSFNILNTVYNISLLYLFLKNVFVLKNNVQKQQEIQLLIRPCVTYTLCLTLSFLSTLSATIFVIIRSYFLEDTNDLHLIRLTLVTLDVFINALSVNLQFNDAQKRCNKLKFCKCCQYCSNNLYSVYGGIDQFNGTEMVEMTVNTSTNDVTVSRLPNLDKSVTTMDTSMATI